MHFQKKQKEDIGISPYEIRIRGIRETATAKISAVNFSVEGAEKIIIESIEDLKTFTDSNDYSWISVVGLGDESIIKDISEVYSIPANIMSDVLDISLRPQVEDFDGGLFTSVRILEVDELGQSVIRDNLSIIVIDKVIFSFVANSDEIFYPIRNRIKRKKSKIHSSGTDYIAFAMLDVVIDNYIYLLDSYGEKVQRIEEELTLNINKNSLKIINLLKQELNHYRRDMKPVKEMILGLRKLDTDFIYDENKTHFKELQDNISQVTEMLDYYREVLYDTLDVYHSGMSTRLNDIMAVLTVFSVVFIPLSFIAGLYGMNFVNMPELKSPYGYFIVLSMMLIIAVTMLIYFRRKKWF